MLLKFPIKCNECTVQRRRQIQEMQMIDDCYNVGRKKKRVQDDSQDVWLGDYIHNVSLMKEQNERQVDKLERK